MSHSIWGAWIEMQRYMENITIFTSRTPSRVRGLEYFCCAVSLFSVYGVLRVKYMEHYEK